MTVDWVAMYKLPFKVEVKDGYVLVSDQDDCVLCSCQYQWQADLVLKAFQTMEDVKVLRRLLGTK